MKIIQEKRICTENTLAEILDFCVLENDNVDIITAQSISLFDFSTTCDLNDHTYTIDVQSGFGLCSVTAVGYSKIAVTHTSEQRIKFFDVENKMILKSKEDDIEVKRFCWGIDSDASNLFVATSIGVNTSDKNSIVLYKLMECNVLSCFKVDFPLETSRLVYSPWSNLLYISYETDENKTSENKANILTMNNTGDVKLVVENISPIHDFVVAPTNYVYTSHKNGCLCMHSIDTSEKTELKPNGGYYEIVKCLITYNKVKDILYAVDESQIYTIKN